MILTIVIKKYPIVVVAVIGVVVVVVVVVVVHRMWRHQPILNYHLSADPDQARKLFEMGMVDACEHHWELLQFFDPDAYVAMLR
jgi:heme exporter protein D